MSRSLRPLPICSSISTSQSEINISFQCVYSTADVDITDPPHPTTKIIITCLGGTQNKYATCTERVMQRGSDTWDSNAGRFVFGSLRLELDRRSVVTRHDPHVTNCAALHVRLPGARSWSTNSRRETNCQLSTANAHPTRVNA
jgi:hypothetical protein